jgi:thiol-disulfide isomerase/thioredoxin
MRFIYITSFFLLFLSCTNTGDRKINKGRDTLNESYDIDPGTILKDYNTWYTYTYYKVPLSQDFIGLDIDSSGIDKNTFLSNLMSGNTVPLKIRLFEGIPVYRLYKLNTEDQSIKSTIQQLASIEMKNYKMEGKQLPVADFEDIHGKMYNDDLMKGKIIVLKCWFIHCVACVKEFPDCNALVNEYADRNDVLFISLALDAKNDLVEFLGKKHFNYAVIPKAESYINDSLNVSMYPTHLLIDKKGDIVKVTNTIEELKPFLSREAGK